MTKNSEFKKGATLLDSNENIMTFIFSAPSVDLKNDVVIAEGIDFNHYITKNPLICEQHNSSDTPIGKTIKLEVINHQLIGTIEFFTDIEGSVGERARTAVALLKKGVTGVSIGFYPIEYEFNSDETGFIIKKCKLIETSWVSIPCNLDSYLMNSLPADVLTAKSLKSKSLNSVKKSTEHARKRKILISE